MIFCFFSGLLTTFIGLNFLINFKVLKNEVKKMSLKNLVSGMFAFVSIILNNKNLIFNFDKKIFSLTESNEDQVPFNFDFNSPPNFNSLQDIQNSLNALKNYKNEYDYFDSFFTGENLFKFFLIVINFVPIIFNSFWADLFYLKNKGNFLVKNLIPNPVFLSIITILMKYFLIENFKPQGFFSFYNIINFTCYFMCIAFVIYEFYLTKNFSFWSIFYLILILLNFIAVSFIQIQPPENLSFKGLNEETPNKFVSQERTQSYKNLAEYGISFNPLGNSGIKGFLEREFYIDNCGTIANAFLLISNYKWEFIPDDSVRKIQVDPPLIQYIYPLKNNYK